MAAHEGSRAVQPPKTKKTAASRSTRTDGWRRSSNRAALGSEAYVFGGTHGAYQPMIQTSWETLKLLANGIELKGGPAGLKENQEQLRRIDLRWHDLRHEGACRLLADRVDIRIIHLMLRHRASSRRNAI